MANNMSDNMKLIEMKKVLNIEINQDQGQKKLQPIITLQTCQS